MAGNMKEWFEGFIANGIQFRLDGSEITAFGVSYKIVIKNISNRVICTTGEVYFHFDNDYYIYFKCRNNRRFNC